MIERASRENVIVASYQDPMMETSKSGIRVAITSLPFKRKIMPLKLFDG